MRNLALLWILCAMMSRMALGAHEGQFLRHMEIEAIEAKWVADRQKIQHLVQSHPKVLEQLDGFVDHLKQAYLSGQGLIHRDVYRIFHAILFAAKKHRYQVRKDPYQTPYLIHPVGVADILITIGNVRDPDILIGALLHDTVEDTPTTFQEIEQEFGKRVAIFVEEVTDDKSLAKSLRKQLQIDHAADKSAGAAQIKLADKLYNLRDLAKTPPLDWEPNRIHDYFQWAQAVIQRLPWVNAPLQQAVHEVIEQYQQRKQ